jgi:Tol biopolymer transport system component
MRKLLLSAALAALLLVGACGPQRTSDLYVFASSRDGGTNLYTAKLSAAELRPVTSDLGPDFLPHASLCPRGERIAFVSDIDGDGEIYLCDLDGSNRQKLTDNGDGEDCPCFTPDGRILFDSDRSGDWEIWIMNADGTGKRQLTNNEDVVDYLPAW